MKHLLLWCRGRGRGALQRKAPQHCLPHCCSWCWDGPGWPMQRGWARWGRCPAAQQACGARSTCTPWADAGCCMHSHREVLGLQLQNPTFQNRTFFFPPLVWGFEPTRWRDADRALVPKYNYLTPSTKFEMEVDNSNSPSFPISDKSKDFFDFLPQFLSKHLSHPSSRQVV